MYECYRCQVVHEGKLNKYTDVMAGCILSPIIFLSVLDRVMRMMNPTMRAIY